jgi:hypothetical protein
MNQANPTIRHGQSIQRSSRISSTHSRPWHYRSHYLPIPRSGRHIHCTILPPTQPFGTETTHMDTDCGCVSGHGHLDTRMVCRRTEKKFDKSPPRHWHCNICHDHVPGPVWKLGTSYREGEDSIQNPAEARGVFENNTGLWDTANIA